MRPLFLAAARPMKVEWKMSPYFGVLPLVFRALGEEYSVENLRPEVSTLLAKAAPPLPPISRVSLKLGWVSIPPHANPQLPEAEKASNVADLETWSLCWALGITQTPGQAITPIAEACIGQDVLVSHHCDSPNKQWAPEVAPECGQVPSLVPEQGLFSPKDLHCGCWILGQVGEAASMSNETCTYRFPN